MAVSNEPASFMHSHFELCAISIFMALMVMIAFVFLEPARFKVPLNWVLAIIIVSVIHFK